MNAPLEARLLQVTSQPPCSLFCSYFKLSNPHFYLTAEARPEGQRPAFAHLTSLPVRFEAQHRVVWRSALRPTAAEAASSSVWSTSASSLRESTRKKRGHMRGWNKRRTTNGKRTMDSARHCAWNVSCAMRNLSLSPIYYACWSQQPH